MIKKCIITITDEINCKISNLPLDIRKLLCKKFEVEKPGAKYLPSVRLGRWNGKVSYFTLGGSTYINLLDQIIPILDNYDYDIELEDIRPYKTTFEFDPITENTFAHKTWPKDHVKEGEPIIFRGYQVSMVNEFLSNPQSIIEAATGSGKTLTTAALSYSVEKYGRSLIVVPNKSLVLQTEEDYINLGLDVGVYFGDRKELNKTHTICTWQSLNNLLKLTQNGGAEFTIKDFIEGVVCVIVDECHQSKAEALKTLLTGVFSHVPIRWGLTGTIPKDPFDQLALLVSLGPVVSKLAASDLQELGVLSNCHVNVIQLKDKKEYKDYQSELKFLTTDPKRLDTLAAIISKIKESGNTLVLVDRVASGKELVERIPDSVFVSGGTKMTERKEEYDEIRTTSDKVLVCTYGVAAVGINIPRIFNLVLLEPGKSFVRVIQSIGRGLRKADDKDFVSIWDICSDCKFSKRHLTQRKSFYRDAKYPFEIEKLDY
jgi:superfamily II DNA or RNA helicase